MTFRSQQADILGGTLLRLLPIATMQTPANRLATATATMPDTEKGSITFVMPAATNIKEVAQAEVNSVPVGAAAKAASPSTSRAVSSRNRASQSHRAKKR